MLKFKQRKNGTKVRRLCLAAVLAVIGVLELAAQGLENPDIGFYPAGLSGAVTALQGYPSAGAWNPAGLPVRKVSDQLLFTRHLNGWFLSANNSAGKSRSTRFTPGTSLFLVRSRTNWTRSYMFYQPYSEPAYRYLGYAGNAATIEGEFTVHALGAAFAFSVSDAVTLGVSAEIHYALFYRNTTYPETVLDDLASVSGFCGNLGLQWRPAKQLTFGAALRLPAPSRPKGSSAVSGVAGSADLDMLLPPRLTLGLGWQPVKNFRVLMDMGAVFWNMSDEITWNRENLPAQTVSTGYKFAFYSALGIIWNISDKFELLYSIKFASGATETDNLGPAADVPLLCNNGGFKLKLSSALALTCTFAWYQGLPQKTAASGYSLLETEFNRMKFSGAAGMLVSF